MSQPVATHIDIRLNRRDLPRAFITGTRVRVQDVAVMAERQGLTPDEIVQALPHLTLGQVHAALSYYFDHRSEIVEELASDHAFADEMRKAQGPGIIDRLLERKTQPVADAVSS
jgi:uncharacterized protein (DUF433 family)